MSAAASFNYSVYDVILRSSVSLPELTTQSDNEFAFRFVLHSPATHSPHSAWFHRLTAIDKAKVERDVMQVARTMNGFLVRFPGYVDFELSEGARLIEAIPAPEATASTVRH